MPLAGRLHYLEAAPSPSVKARGALLLLHAFPLNARMWEPQLAPFAARGWHVVAPHFRGFGESTLEPGSEPTVDDYAGDVIDLLDALHVHEAVVAGLSLGGYVALAMVRCAARYVQALVLADTKAEPDTPEAAVGRIRMAQLARDRGVDAVVDELLPRVLGQSTRSHKPHVVATVERLARSSSVEAVTSGLGVLRTRPDSTPLLASIHVPALVIVGSEDAITPPAVAETMHRAIAGSALVVVPGAGHLSNLEDTDAFDVALAEFLDHRV